MHYPINWVAGLVVVVGTGIVMALVFVVVVLGRGWRWVSWPREQRRREALPAVMATVESSTRITEAGDFRLVLLVHGARVKGIVRLTDEAVEHIEERGTLPVRADAAEPQKLVVDLRALGTEAVEAFERQAYLARGTPPWMKV